jgi:hypothetical protein
VRRVGASAFDLASGDRKHREQELVLYTIVRICFDIVRGGVSHIPLP